MKNKQIIILSLAFLITTPLAVFAGVKYDQKLTEKMKGKILLQVESKGEAWYVNPKDGKRYYMKDGDSALQIMRKFGVGIKSADLEKIQAGTVETASANSTAIGSQTEAKKQTAWTLTQTFTGINDLNTAPFMLKNGSWFKVKYTYTPNANYNTAFGIVLKDPSNILNSAVLANEMVDNGTTITTENNVYNKSTDIPFFFDVMATGSWKVEVYENI